MSSILSDHLFISIDVSFKKQSVSGKFISYKLIDEDAFLADLRLSLMLDNVDGIHQLVNLYNSRLIHVHE